MAYSVNKAIVIGNLTRDPELRQTPSGQQVCSFSVATNRTWKDAQGNKQEAADYHNVVAWGKLAEICGQYLTKGKKVYVEGRMQTRDWEGKDGQKKSRTEIVIEDMVMLDKGGAPGGSSAGGYTPRTASATSMPKMGDEPAASADDEIKIEDIPF